MSKKNTVAEETDSALDDILNRSWDELPEEKNLPAGPWLLKGRNAAVMMPQEGSDKDPKILFFYTAIEPGEGVDEDKLAELAAVNYDFASNDLSYTVYIEKASDWKKKVGKHLAKHGIDMEAAGTIKKALEAFKNARVFAEIGIRSYEDKKSGEQVEVNSLSNFTKVEED